MSGWYAKIYECPHCGQTVVEHWVDKRYSGHCLYHAKPEVVLRQLRSEGKRAALISHAQAYQPQYNSSAK